jgi:Domain of unknown function (DUF1823)
LVSSYLSVSLFVRQHYSAMAKSITQLLPLETKTIWAILNESIDDATANQIVWYHLGYRYNADMQTWDTSAVDPSWLEEYPEPPNFIESRPATVKLTRSIPKENKQLLKEKLGFKGYKIGEFGPRQTRRATMANWLLGLMEELPDA